MAVFFSDTFTDTNGTVLDDHTPEVGTGWIERNNSGSNMEIEGNEVTGDGGVSDGALYTANATYPSNDYDVTQVIGEADTSDDTFHVIARWTDNNNMLALRYNEDVFALHKKVAGTWTTIANRAANVPVDGDEVGIRVSGSSATILKNGAEIATVTGLDTVLLTGVAGVAIGGGAVNRVSTDDVSQQTITSFEIDNTGAATVDIAANNLAVSGSLTQPAITQTQIIASNNLAVASNITEPSLDVNLAQSGKTDIGALDVSLAGGGNDFLHLRKFTLADAAVIKSVFAATNISSGSNATVRARIFNDSSGTVGTVIDSTSNATPAGTSFAFQEFTFTTDPDLPAGDYWIGVEGQYNGLGVANIAYDTGGATNEAYEDLLPFGGGTYDDKDLSIYIEYEASNSVSIEPNALSVATDITQPALSQTHAIVGNDLAASTTISEPAITQTHEIASDNLTVAHSLSEPTIDQSVSIDVDDLTIAHSLTEPAITQTHGIVVNDLSVASSLTSPDITQTHAIAADNLTVDHTIESPTVAIEHNVVVDALTNAHSLTEPAIGQEEAIYVDDLTVGHSLSEPAITQTHIIVVDNLAVDHSLTEPAVTQDINITPDDIVSAHSLSEPDVEVPSAPVYPIFGIVVVSSVAREFVLNTTNLPAATMVSTVPVDITLRKLRLRLSAAPGGGNSRTFTVRKNGSDTALAVTISGSDTLAENLSDEISFVAGDTVSINATLTGSPPTGTTTHFSLEQTGDSQFWPSGNSSARADARDFLPGATGVWTEQPTANDAIGLVMPTAGTISKLYINSTVAPGVGNSWTANVQKNASNSSLTLTLADANTTANDTANTVDVVAGDIIRIRETETGTAATSRRSYSLAFTPDTAGQAVLPMASGNALGSVNGVTEFGNVGNFWQSTEVISHHRYLGNWTIKNFYAASSVAAGAGDTWNVTIRKNGVDTALTLALANTTAVQDVTSDVELTASDYLTLKVLTTGTTVTNSLLYGGILLEAAVDDGTIDIVANNLTVDHTLEEPTITQTHEIDSDDLTNAHSLTEPVVTQAQIIAVDDLTHASTITEPTVTIEGNIAPDNLTVNHSLTEPSITQTHQIAIDDLTIAHSIEQPNVTVNATEIEPNDLAHSTTLTEPVITQTHQISTDSLTVAHSLTSPSIEQIVDINVDDLTVASTLTEPAIAQTHQITAQNLTNDHSLSEPTIGVTVDISPDDLLQALNLTEPTLQAIVDNDPDDLLNGHSLTSPTVQVLHDIAVNDLIVAHSLAQPNVLLANLVDETFVTLNAQAVIGLSMDGNTMTVRVVNGTIEAQSLTGQPHDTIGLTGSPNDITLIGP